MINTIIIRYDYFLYNHKTNNRYWYKEIILFGERIYTPR